MPKIISKAMGILLVASTVLTAMPATAQVVPGGGAPTRGAQATVTAVDTAHTGLPRVIAVTRDDVTGGFRAPVEGDNSMGVLSMEEFVAQQVARGGTREMATAQYAQIAEQNANGCQETGEWVREAIAITNEAQIIDQALFGFYDRLDRLGRAQGRAAAVSTGASIGATGALCALSAGLYCVAGALVNGGSIFQTGANRRAQRLDVDMRHVNVDQSRLQIRATLLNMRATIGWAERFQAWCLVTYPNQTAGVQLDAGAQAQPALFSAQLIQRQQAEAARDAAREAARQAREERRR